MNIRLSPQNPSGRLAAICSKSAAHRLLICAALADAPTKIVCERTNADIDATARCLSALGAKIEYTQGAFFVTPIDKPKVCSDLHCGESGSTLRFLLPIIPAIGASARFFMEGRLPERPLSPLYEELLAHGAHLGRQGSNPLEVGGTLGAEVYTIRGDVSSQFISGLLFALCANKNGGKIQIIGKTESEPYIDMTIEALRAFGVSIQRQQGAYIVPPVKGLVSPREIRVEGDWSNAAFMLSMGVLGKSSVTLTGLSQSSTQGDMAICDILRKFGASIEQRENEVTAHGCSKLHGTDIDASQIPDLVPVLATVASVAEGTTRIYGASRLRLKESDRIASVCNMLTSLGANITPTDDGMIITGVAALSGGVVQTENDHRIAMSAATAAAASAGSIEIVGAECVAKSYPDFWSDIKIHLGVGVDE